jgi:hypothetical protein
MAEPTDGTLDVGTLNSRASASSSVGSMTTRLPVETTTRFSSGIGPFSAWR